MQYGVEPAVDRLGRSVARAGQVEERQDVVGSLGAGTPIIGRPRRRPTHRRAA